MMENNIIFYIMNKNRNDSDYREILIDSVIFQWKF